MCTEVSLQKMDIVCDISCNRVGQASQNEQGVPHDTEPIDRVSKEDIQTCFILSWRKREDSIEHSEEGLRKPGLCSCPRA